MIRTYIYTISEYILKTIYVFGEDQNDLEFVMEGVFNLELKTDDEQPAVKCMQ
jgi:hypothetical protein